MKERPIIFSTPMVQAILGGAKTQTRREVKAPDWIDKNSEDKPHWMVEGNSYNGFRFIEWGSDHAKIHQLKCPYGQIGDVLWVRETWNYVEDTSYDEHVSNGGYVYKADRSYEEDKWKPSIFMPREACRIRLKITDIRVERLQDISEEDAKSEGVERYTTKGHTDEWIDYQTPYEFFCIDAKESFRSLWRSINGHESWDSNPFVWVISFEKIPSF